MARRPLCAENVPQIEHFEILRPVCAQYTCVTTRKTRVCLYTISSLQHTRIHAIYKQGTHTYAMSLIQNEEPKQAPQASVFPPLYVANSIQQCPVPVPMYQNTPQMHTLGLHHDPLFTKNGTQTQPTALCMQTQPTGLALQTQPQALCMQPQPAALCMQPLQMVHTTVPSQNCFFVQ